jgi:hypothetical protein
MTTLNLDVLVQKVWQAPNVTEKRHAAREMINYSRAKAATKVKALRDIESMSSTAIDRFVTNYSFSGSGMKVR